MNVDICHRSFVCSVKATQGNIKCNKDIHKDERCVLTGQWALERSSAWTECVWEGRLLYSLERNLKLAGLGTYWQKAQEENYSRSTSQMRPPVIGAKTTTSKWVNRIQSIRREFETNEHIFSDAFTETQKSWSWTNLKRLWKAQIVLNG